MTSQIKAVLFDVGGVIVPQPQKSFALYMENIGLPHTFLLELFVNGVPNNAFCKLERGELTLTEFYGRFEQEALEKAKKEAVVLPKSFNAKDLIDSYQKPKTVGTRSFDRIVHLEMLRAATILRQNGILTCIVTNNWISDDEDRKITTARFMRVLSNYFNEVVQSCTTGLRKPDKEIYMLACNKLGVNPNECAFLDDLGNNLKAAKSLGITCIKVKDPIEALKELENVTGISLLSPDMALTYPAPSHPDSVAHGYVEVQPGIKIHYVESGNGPAVVLLHGFPDFWYGWRHQIPALANAGYRAIVPDQRGYGESSSPPDVDAYSHEELCGDVICLMDKLGIGVAIVVGHDWGGSVAWSLALKYPQRFRGVCGVNTPFFRINPSRNPLKSMYENPGVFDYQLYFQTPGVAEKELEKDVEQTFLYMYRGAPKEKISSKALASTSNVRERGGMFVGLPKNIRRSPFMTAFDLKYYAEAFDRDGFRGPLNWYRNYENNWKWSIPVANRKITMPALMVTASHDAVLKPEYSFGMEERVVNLKRLHIEQCSHWTLQEKPHEFNQGFIKWLDEVHSGCGLSAKL